MFIFGFIWRIAPVQDADFVGRALSALPLRGGHNPSVVFCSAKNDSSPYTGEPVGVSASLAGSLGAERLGMTDYTAFVGARAIDNRPYFAPGIAPT